MPEPTAGFYLYPDFSGSRAHLAGLGIQTSGELAGYLLDERGIATLPGSAFGDPPERLTLRIATPMLYGLAESSRWQALGAKDPTPPWLAEALQRLDKLLATL